jgi:hypothetical protein
VTYSGSWRGSGSAMWPLARCSGRRILRRKGSQAGPNARIAADEDATGSRTAARAVGGADGDGGLQHAVGAQGRHERLVEADAGAHVAVDEERPGVGLWTRSTCWVAVW